MEATKERRKLIPVKSAPSNHNHTIQDQTAGGVLGDVDSPRGGPIKLRRAEKEMLFCKKAKC